MDNERKTGFPCCDKFFFSGHRQSVLLILLYHMWRLSLKVTWGLIISPRLLRTCVLHVLQGMLRRSTRRGEGVTSAYQRDHLLHLCTSCAPTPGCVWSHKEDTTCCLSGGLLFILQTQFYFFMTNLDRAGTPWCSHFSWAHVITALITLSLHGPYCCLSHPWDHELFEGREHAFPLWHFSSLALSGA